MTNWIDQKRDDLRAELKRRNLPCSGNKPELAARLQADDAARAPAVRLQADDAARASADRLQADDAARASADNLNPVDATPPAHISDTPTQLGDDASTLLGQFDAPADRKGKRRASPSPFGVAGPSRHDQLETTTSKRRRVDPDAHTDILSVLQDACDDPASFPRLRARIHLTVKDFCSNPDKLQSIAELFGEDPELIADELSISDQKDRELYIKQIIEKDVTGSMGTGFVWAAYHLMPLEQLKANTQIPHPVDFKNTLIQQGKDIIDKWLARSKKAGASTPTASRSRAPSVSLLNQVVPGSRPSTPRSKSARDACWRRDNGVCVLTGWENPEVAHIYPFALNNQKDPSFWDLLSRFWGDEKVNAWREAVGLTTEKCSNLICLAPVFHTWWGKARFALKPIFVSTTEIRIQFFWLQRANHGPNDNVDLLASPEDALTDQRCYRGYKPIENGTIFTIIANDPDELPSFEILNMQWYLQRLAAMSGAADVDQEVSNDDDPETPFRGRTLQRLGGDWGWPNPEGSDYGLPDQEIMSEYDGSLMDNMISAAPTVIT